LGKNLENTTLRVFIEKLKKHSVKFFFQIFLMTSDQEANSDYKYWINVEHDPNNPVNLVDAGNHYDKGHLYPNFMASFQFPLLNHPNTAAEDTKKSREATFAKVERLALRLIVCWTI
jgi:hypothetical protein